jgi:hypothetical protein
MNTGDHHDNRYEDGEPLPELDWNFTPACPLDGGEGVLLGQLGRLTHYRCRACGIVFNA